MSITGGDPGKSLVALFSTCFDYYCAIFVLLGIVTTMLGPMLPVLSLRWHLSPAMAGTLFTWQFCAATLGTLVSSRLARNFSAVLCLGLSFCVVGVLGLAYLPWPYLRLAVAFYGVGLGFSIPAINLVVSEKDTFGHPSALAVLNSCWTIGAVIGPLLMRSFISIRMFLLTLAAMLLVSLVTAMSQPTHCLHPLNTHAGTDPESSHLAVTGCAALFFIYVGSENALSGWISTYAVPILQSEKRGMVASSVFWASFLSTRIMSPSFFRSVRVSSIFFISISISILGIICLFFAQTTSVMFLGISLTGLGLGAIYPILIADMVGRLGADHPAATICFAFSGLGAAILPFLSGWLGQATGRTRNGLGISLFALFLIPFFYAAMSSLRHPPVCNDGPDT